MKKLLLVVLAAVVVISMAACNGGGGKTQPAPAPEPAPAPAPATTPEPAPAPAGEFNKADYPIGVVSILRTHPVIQIMVAGALDRAEELGYPVYLYANDGDAGAEAYALGDTGLAQQGLKGIVILAFDDSTNVYAKKWKDQGCLTVLCHAQVKKEEYPDVIAWAACSAEDYGRKTAHLIAKEVGEKGTVAITCGNYTMNEAEAADAFKEEMEANYPDIKVLDPQEEGFDTPIAIQRATSIIQANPDIVGAFSTTGAGSTTWATAQKNAGKKLICVSMDYSKPNLDLVKSGEMYAVIAAPLFAEFAWGVDILDKAFKGEPYEYNNPMDAPFVTLENVDEYYALIDKVNEIMKKY